MAVVASPASIPTVIKKKDELPGYDIKGVDDSRYSVVITENDKPDPFALSPEMVQITNEVVAPYRRNELRKRAKAIFDWMQKNVPYDEAMKRRIESKEKGEYRGADYTLQDRAGVCGEQAVLYIAMARLAGLQAKYVSVKEDYTGKEVSHGCAGINADVGEFILVDPAYHQFDIKHKKFEAWDDEKVRAVFRVWNKN
ncbi:transglutaminase domain-containing protein [bacterium]|nr:transglutaminase domain-containing protein [candidate division CSSED10-310 bacterium]